MQQTLKAKHELRLYELKKTADEFLEFTKNLTLLAVVNPDIPHPSQDKNDLNYA